MTSESDVHKGQAPFERNRQLLAEIERDLAAGGGAGDDAPDAADVLRAARRQRQRRMRGIDRAR